jgi:hypothetical protein
MMVNTTSCKGISLQLSLLIQIVFIGKLLGFYKKKKKKKERNLIRLTVLEALATSGQGVIAVECGRASECMQKRQNRRGGLIL